MTPKNATKDLSNSILHRITIFIYWSLGTYYHLLNTELSNMLPFDT